MPPSPPAGEGRGEGAFERSGDSRPAARQARGMPRPYGGWLASLSEKAIP